jgi:hypothetical protein
VAAVALLALAMTSLTAWTLLRDTDAKVGNDTASPGVTSPTSGPTGAPTQTGDPTSGPGFTTNSRISAGGVVETSSTVVFDQPVSSMTITVPGANTAWLAGDFHPKVAHLLVTAGGAPLPDVAGRLAAGGSDVVALPPGTTAVDMTYRATGVVIRTTPSIPTRALVLVNPLWVSAGSSLSTSVHVVGARILNLGCSGPDIAAAACGAPAAGGWQVNNAAGAGEVAVVAQVDLPKQRSAR